MIDAILECVHFGIQPAKPTIIFGNAGALVEESLPVLGRPAVVTRPQQPHDPSLVAR